MISCCPRHRMWWSGATGAIARCKNRSTGYARRDRSVHAWRSICGVKPTPKAVNKPSPPFIVHGLDKPGGFTTVSTVERIMALNRRVYTDIPGTEALHAPPAVPQPHPFKATAAHEYWFIDGRMMDFAIEGHRWWSLIILDGYSRTMLAGAVAPSEASWVALTV